jgi:thiamine kinase-like enzyme
MEARKMTITINQVVQKIEDWQGQHIEVEPVTGGLTNTNYRVIAGGDSYFVRIPGESTDLLAVDRENEYYNTKAAAQAGVGPEVKYYLPEDQVMVLEFIEGKTMSNESLHASGMPSIIAQSIHQLHSGPRFKTDFNMFRLTEFYLRIVDQYEVPIPSGYHEHLATFRQIEKALAVNPLPNVPCNNDLLAENYLYDGEKMWLIDYEYSGNNDPCFDLGNTCQELEYDESRILELCESYFGQAYPDKVARMKLFMIMSDVGWALWAAIQQKISKIEYDFWGWAIERWARATGKMDSPDYPGWLQAVQKKENI